MGLIYSDVGNITMTKYEKRTVSHPDVTVADISQLQLDSHAGLISLPNTSRASNTALTHTRSQRWCSSFYGYFN